jgi:hypothetical protein
LQFAPVAPQPDLYAAIQRLLAGREPLEEFALSRVEPVKAGACQEVELDSIPVDDMNAGRGAAEKDVLAVVQNQRNQVGLPVVTVVRRVKRVLRADRASLKSGFR